MRLSLWTKWFSGVATLLVLPTLLMGATGHFKTPSSTSDEWESPNEASVLLQKIRNQAIDVRDLAGQLQAFIRDGSDTDWEGDADVLTRATAHVNAMDDTLYSLRSIRQQAAPWQQKAIDRIAPKVIELTDYFQAAVHSLNNNPITLHLLDQNYAQDTAGMYQRANTIANSIGRFENYATARAEARRLSRKLDLSAAS